MTKQTINIGTTSNDHTGDSLRDAFGKVNDNFDELYSTSGGIVGYNQANMAYAQANAAYDTANNAVTDYSPAFNKANSAYDLANGAYNYANTISPSLVVNSTGITGGSNGAILFDKNGVVGENSGLRWDNANAILTANTMVAATGGFALGSAPSYGSHQWSITGTGGSYLRLGHGNQILFVSSYSENMTMDGDAKHIRLPYDYALGFSSTSVTTDASKTDVKLYRDSANTLAQRNGTAPQSFHVYNSYTDPSNYALGRITWSGNQLYIGSVGSGTGTAGPVNIQAGNTLGWQFATNGNFLAYADNTYDIGANGDNRPRGLYLGTTGGYSAGGWWITTTNAAMGWSSRATFDSPADAEVTVSGQSSTNTKINFGGRTNTYPSLKRSGAGIDIRLADDSGYATLRAGTVYSAYWEPIIGLSGYGLTYGDAKDVNGIKPSGGFGWCLGITSPAIALGSNTPIQWESGSTVGNSNTIDLVLRRDAAGTLALRNSTNAQAFNIYNTYTDASNYERGFISWKNTANTFVIGTEAAGTGTARSISLSVGGQTALTIESDKTATFGGVLVGSHIGNDYYAGTFNYKNYGGIYFSAPYSGATVYSGLGGAPRGWMLFMEGTPSINHCAGYGITFCDSIGFWNQSDVSRRTSDVILSRASAGVMKLAGATAGTGALVVDGNVSCSYIKTSANTYANLVSAVTAGAGARAYITDSNTNVFLAIVGGGGANNVPVSSDGTNWRVG